MEKDLSKISNYLLKGGKMLSTHHTCGAPLIEYKGETLCPLCDVTIKSAGAPQQPMPKASQQQDGTMAAVDSVLRSKLTLLNTKLAATEDPAYIKQLLDTLEQCLRCIKLSADLA